MKQFSVAVFFIMFVVLNICGADDNGFWRADMLPQLAQSSDEFSQFEMPIIKINTVSGDTINSKETYTEAKISVINKQGNYEMTDSSISIRLRGNVTLAAEKKSYKIKFPEKQNMLNVGAGGGKTWCLISNCYDGSLLRNLAICRIADSLDGLQYSPNCLSVELFINSEYRGVYLLSEDVNINQNRVVIEEKPEEIENNSYLIEMSRYDENDSFTVDKATYRVKSELSPTESVKKQQIAYISEYLTKCINALKTGDRTVVEQYINTKSLVDLYIINEIVKNIDVGWSSFYSYKKAGGKLEFGPPWDFDLSMGNVNCIIGFDSSSGINPYNVLNVNASSNPWFCYALGHKWFRDSVQQRWTALKDKLSKLPAIVTTEAETHNKSYCRNYEKWNNVLGKQVYIEPKQIVALSSFKEHYTYLGNWLEKRIKWLTDYYAADDFENGKFIDERGNELTLETNRVALSSILAFAGTPDVKITCEILPTQGMTMTIVNGGKEYWDAQIGVTGFMIEKGEQYEISFDYKSSADCPLPFDIQQNHKPYKSFFYEELKSTGEFQQFKTTFTVSKSDNNCALIFSLGGTTFNGATVTIDNMSMVLKKPSKINKPYVQTSESPANAFWYDSKRGIVHFNLPATTPTDFSLYSVNGRKVYAVSEKKNAGEHAYLLNNIGLVPGAYIGQIKAGSHSRQCKMMIPK